MSIQPPGERRRAWWRTGLRIVAGLLGGIVLYTWITPVVGILLLTLRGQPLPVEATRVTTGLVLDDIGSLTVALVAWGCIVLADGRRAMGLHGSVSQHARVLGHYLVTATVARRASVIVAAGLVWMLPGLATATGNDGLNITELPYGYLAFRSVVAGISEEILVVALAWRLLEYLPTREGRRPFVMAGAATALLVGLRLAYHLYYGVWVLEDVIPAWLTVRLYRQTRMLLPLIVLHAAYDLLLVTFPPQFEPLCLLAAGIVLVCIQRPDGHKWYWYFGWRSNTTPAHAGAPTTHPAGHA